MPKMFIWSEGSLVSFHYSIKGITLSGIQGRVYINNFTELVRWVDAIRTRIGGLQTPTKVFSSFRIGVLIDDGNARRKAVYGGIEVRY